MFPSLWREPLFFGSNQIDEAKQKVDEVAGILHRIESNTGFINQSLVKPSHGGLSVTVGVNNVELRENIAIVFKDNELNLKTGDVFYLQNYGDNTFRSIARFVVQKEIETPDKSTKAQLFISDEAAKRLGIYNYRQRGIFPMKLLREANERQKGDENTGHPEAVSS